MKKLLLILMLLALMFFLFYPTHVDGMNTSKETIVSPKVIDEGYLKKEILNIYNNSKDEVYKDVKREENLSKKIFSVSIKGELNTTKEKLVTLNAHVENVEAPERCNYFWYENKKLIGLGKTLQKGFSKGEHKILLTVRDANGTETSANVLLNAYNYHVSKRFNYAPYYGELLYVAQTIYDHKEQCIFRDDGVFSKSYFLYDEEGNLIEKNMEYYYYPEQKSKTVYTYDENSNRLVTQTFNSNGESVSYNLNIYDEQGVLIDMKYGTNADDLEAPYAGDEGTIYYEDPYAETQSETTTPKNISELNEQGQVIYEEHYYGDNKMVRKITYNDKGKMSHSEYTNSSPYGTNVSIVDYDEYGHAIRTEKKHSYTNHESCHYINESTYTKDGVEKTDVNTILSGECPYVDEVKREFMYDEVGRITNIKVISQDGEQSSHDTYKVEESYTNEIDI